MPDYIKSAVEQVIDERTLLVDVEFIGDTNRAEYDDVETIQIEKPESPFFKNIPKGKGKERLENKLLGVTEYCHLLSKIINGHYKRQGLYVRIQNSGANVSVYNNCVNYIPFRCITGYAKRYMFK
ncbi:MAG: hypothetical protein COC05_00730 [Gammaproteobacteria bacterium]|nr:MAG: hypothetical protein COC05_00730 [Gammaproteobacteria bacterium]